MVIEQSEQRNVDATPVKSFFVRMLTRDIKLEGAILDLLDNCVDGILREEIVDSPKPYEGRWAAIDFTQDSFMIKDNCGGISKKNAIHAFRLGRDPRIELEIGGGIGVYGIGMKRAIFKIGESCLVKTRCASDEYEVVISQNWIKDEDDWLIPMHDAKTDLESDGTSIEVKHLHPGIAMSFVEYNEAFQSDLIDMIASYYSTIIMKGFRVTVNGKPIQPLTRGLIYNPSGDGPTQMIRPFVYKVVTDADVEVFMAVGFTRPIPTQDEVDSNVEIKQNSTEDAGWTIVCNDRAVVFCDKTVLTGWGEASVPRYHTQFIAVSGLVEFKCSDPGELPMTTTKQGIDASSSLFLEVKNKMREGMKYFTDYTNDWKGLENETKNQFAACETAEFSELKTITKKWRFNATTRSIAGSRQYRPRLPKPSNDRTRRRRISFSKETDKVVAVSKYLFGDQEVRPSLVGERCFDEMYVEATE